jgi:uncharacterized protein YlaI
VTFCSLVEVHNVLEEHTTSSSGLKNKPKATSKKLLAQPHRWRQYIAPKCHDLMSDSMVLYPRRQHTSVASSFLLGILFNFEDGGSMFLQNLVNFY